MRLTRAMARRGHEAQQHIERSSAITKRRAKVVSKVTSVDREPWPAKSVTSFADLDSTEDADRSRSTSRSEAYDQQESASSVAISGAASIGGDKPVMPVFASYGLTSSMGTTNSLIGSIKLVPVTVAGWEGQLGIVTPWSQTPTLLCNLKTLMSNSDWIPLRHGLDDDLERAFYTPGQTVLGNVSGLSKHISFMAMWTNPSYTRAMSLCRDLKTGARAEAQPWIVQMLFFGEPTYGVDESLQSIKHDQIVAKGESFIQPCGQQFGLWRMIHNAILSSIGREATGSPLSQPSRALSANPIDEYDLVGGVVLFDSFQEY